MKIYFAQGQLCGWHRLYHAHLDGAFKIVAAPQEADLIFNWSTDSVYCRPLPGAVNGLLTDVSKLMVEHCFRRVYGYESHVMSGLAVEKVNAEQGKKNCRIVNLDFDPMLAGRVYQRLLFDAKDEQVQEDRFVIMNGQVVMLTIKTKLVSMKDIAGRVIDVHYTTDVKESKLEEFCRQIGLDFGEIDTITYDGQFYVLDVNNIAGDALFFGAKGAEIKKAYIKLFKQHYVTG